MSGHVGTIIFRITVISLSFSCSAFGVQCCKIRRLVIQLSVVLRFVVRRIAFVPNLNYYWLQPTVRCWEEAHLKTYISNITLKVFFIYHRTLAAIPQTFQWKRTNCEFCPRNFGYLHFYFNYDECVCVCNDCNCSLIM
jgi:hypothetical protein